MKRTIRWNLLAFTLVASVGSAANYPSKSGAEAVQLPAQQVPPAGKPKQIPVKIDSEGVVVNDGVTETKEVPAEKDAKPRDPAAEAELAAQAEKARVAEEASAFAKGEGERYARRQKAYEAARQTSRPPVERPKKSSIAELQLADGRYVVVAGGDRKVFANKAAAEPYLAEIRQAETDRPLVLGSAPRK